MNSETKNCKNCKNSFNLEAEDFGFYEKMEVPAPTLCYDCRRQRRLAWRNDINLYHRECALCNKKVISFHPVNNGMIIYCNKCWWSDNWDPYQYGRDVDFSRPMFEQLAELQRAVPNLALINDNNIASVNCEYTQDVAFSKDCYMIFVAWKMEKCCYVRYGANAKECVDSDSVFENNELVYEGIFLQNCYSCRYVYFSSGLSDCSFCYDCKGCSDCFMSIGLRQKKYCFKNEQYTKEEYEEILATYKLETWSGEQKAYQEFLDFILPFPRRHANLIQCVDCTGNDLIYGKNSKNCFNIIRLEDCKNFENGDTVKDCYDCTIGGECERCYDCITPDHGYHVRFSIESWKNNHITYCENCHSSENLFGCFSLRKGSYAILNKRYSKEEYNVLVPKIIEHMKKTGEWGEFFPAGMSYLGYNETLANDYYPMTKEEVLSRGWQWQDDIVKPVGKSTLSWDKIPDSIDDTDESILNEILACELCNRDYRIVRQEFDFYHKMHIPIPHHCFYCRIKRRMSFRNPSQLWERTTEDGVKVMTAYAPDRPEKILSEKGYNDLVN